jgi:hypothetical protein
MNTKSAYTYKGIFRRNVITLCDITTVVNSNKMCDPSRLTIWPTEKNSGCKDPNAPQLYILHTFPVLIYVYLIMPHCACVNPFILLFYFQSHTFWLILISANIKQDDSLILANTKLLPSVVPIHRLLEEMSKNPKQEYNSRHTVTV